MKITFKHTAYTSIGFNASYTGKFLKEGNHYTEADTGELMTLHLPDKFVTVGKQLTERN